VVSVEIADEIDRIFWMLVLELLDGDGDAVEVTVVGWWRPVQETEEVRGGASAAQPDPDDVFLLGRFNPVTGSDRLLDKNCDATFFRSFLRRE
jgi:hypothetical protein